jgi:hypothetical protein
MKPEISDYKILKFHNTYFVLNPYDLYAMPALQIVGSGFSNIEQAKSCAHELHKCHMREYERLQKMGRSFPDND